MCVFICPFCGNKDQRYVGYINGVPYCRLCIRYSNREAVIPNKETDYSKTKLCLPYELTPSQRRISEIICEEINHGKNVFIQAVTGAGKTEITVAAISKFLKRGYKIGFCIPRKDVVIELYDRIKSLFKNTKVVAVYGGHKDIVDGDIIVLTTHQLYRYQNFFDLLVLDEADAFPFKNNEVLQCIFKNSIRGHYIIMSATLENSQDIIKDDNVVNLNLFQRFHKHDIPVPKIVKKCGIFKIIYIIKSLKKYLELNKPVLIFVPTIELSKQLYFIVKNFAEPGYFVNSKEEKRDEIIRKFKRGEYKFLFTTMVLERGVTIENLQVIIFDADNEIFDKESLIQIGGRAGRKASFPDGDVIYLANSISEAMTSSIERIKYFNKNKDKIYDL